MALYPIDILLQTVSGPYFGLDWGTKRMGLAISDAHNKLAMPLTTLDARFWPPVFRHLHTLRVEWNIQAIIVGWPLYQSGEESPNCQKVQRFIEALLAHEDWPIALWDERSTTQESTHWRLPGETSHADAHAATLLLQSVLQRLNRVPLQQE